MAAVDPGSIGAALPLRRYPRGTVGLRATLHRSQALGVRRLLLRVRHPRRFLIDRRVGDAVQRIPDCESDACGLLFVDRQPPAPALTAAGDTRRPGYPVAPWMAPVSD
jgi:hypothetical protein